MAAKFTRPAHFFIRVEFHGAAKVPNVYALFHKALAGSIFQDQYFDPEEKKYFDLPRATYYAQKSMSTRKIAEGIQSIANNAIRQATEDKTGVAITVDIFVIKGAEPYPLITNKAPVGKRTGLRELLLD